MSNANIIKFVSICFVCCGTLMFILFITMAQSNSIKNGFTRHLPVTKLIAAKETALKEDGFYIAGHTSRHIYLGNIQKPFYLFVSDSNLQNIHPLRLQFPEGIRYSWQSARISVDSPHVYLADGITPRFFRGDLANLKMDTFMSRTSYFTAAINISPGSFAVRAVNANAKENMLLKVQSDSPYVIETAGIFKKQVDGIFCTDGMFKYDKTSNRLIYMYYYRNQCLLLDTNLHLIKAVNTIDTTTTAKISIATTSAEGNARLSSPPAFVNATVCMDEGKVYIRSALLADNETLSTINRNNIVDVYAAGDGRYIRSLYIPKKQDGALMEMLVFNHQLIALYAGSYVIYNLPQDLPKVAVAEKLNNRVGTIQ